MKDLMKNWRKFVSESQAPTDGFDFPEQDIIDYAFRLVNNYAQPFIKDSTSINNIRFSKSGNALDRNSDGHMKGVYGKYLENVLFPTINYIEAAFDDEEPRAQLKTLLRNDDSDGLADAIPFKTSDKMIFINLNIFIRLWAELLSGEHARSKVNPAEVHPWWRKYTFKACSLQLAGTIVHEIAHAEDENEEKFTKIIVDMTMETLKDAVRDGLFNPKLYGDMPWFFGRGKARGKRSDGMAIFLDHLKSDYGNLATAKSVATETFAYDTEVEFYRSVLSNAKGDQHKLERKYATHLVSKTIKGKKSAIGDKYKKA